MKGRISLALAAWSLLASVASATNYFETEPNNSFPAPTLTGDPYLNSGDLIFGALSPAGDVDQHSIHFPVSQLAQIYRYTLEFNAGTGAGGGGGSRDSLLTLFDDSSEGHAIAFNDDFPNRNGQSTVVFEHPEMDGREFRMSYRAETFSGQDIMNSYFIRVTREVITPTFIGVLEPGLTMTNVISPVGGNGNWLRFFLQTESDVVIDTLGSLPSLDTELAIFDENGQTVGGADDIDATLNNYLSKTTLHLVPGEYYIAVGRYNMAYNWDVDTNQRGNWSTDGFGLFGDGQTTSTFLTVNVTVSPTEYFADSMQVLQGEFADGEITNTRYSDDKYVSLFSDPESLAAKIEFTATATQHHCSRMRLYAEGGSERAGLAFAVKMFRYTDNQWFTAFGQTSTGDDASVLIDLSGASADAFLGDTGELATRFEWAPINDESPAQDGWLLRVDQVRWILNG